jgi:hypothetical protein
MATNPAFDAFFRDAAARLAQNRQIGPANPNPYAGSTFKPTEFNEAKKRETDWNLGQGIIDTLSTGTYAVAGIGARIGESVDKLAQGDFSNVIPDIAGTIPGVNFLDPTGRGGLFGATARGIEEKRTWSQNLKDAGADDTTAAAAGLALDIALDPTWLIGGGLITAGVKGTASGIRATSAANKAGVKLSKEGYEAVKTGSSATSPLTYVEAGNAAGKGWFQEQGKIGALSGDAFGNLLAGVRQGNVEAFANLKTAKAKAKAEKAELKAAKKAGLDKITKATTLSGDDAIRVTQPTEDLGTTIAKAEEEAFDTNPTTTAEEVATTIPTPDSAPVVQQVTNTIEDVAKTSAKPKRKANIEKDANTVEEAVVLATDAPSVYKAAREQVGALKQKYMDARGIKAVDADFATIKASEDAGKIAKAYDDMFSDPTNPAVINAYRQLAREVRDQYDYMVNELGIKVDFIDGDPYNVINAAGKSVPDSKLFMQDIMENKRLQVRGSAQDFAIDPHPLLSAEENDMFRAVHDFFGHAASGRGVAQNGEEAAWVSHSQMFSTEARKAMTTETRGQNSWSNTEGFGVDPITKEQRFAQQKVGFLPDEYLITGPERELLEQLGLRSNSLIGATGARLVEFADTLMYDLERVSSPTKNMQYTKEQIATFKKEVAKIVQKNEGYQPGSTVHKTLDGMLQLIFKAIANPSQVKLGSAFDDKLVTITAEAGIKETKNLSKGQGVNKTAGIIEPDEVTTRNLDEADQLAEVALREADENVDVMGDFNAANVQATAGATFTGSTSISLLGLVQGARQSANQIADTTEVGLAARAMIEILDKPLDVTELVIAALKAEGKTLEVIKPFEPTFYGTSPKSYGKPNISEEDLRRMFPDDPLVTNANDLRHAMGKTPYRANENVARRVEKQQQLWAAFRQRNENTINQLELLEKENWQGQLTEFGDEIYQQFANGMIAKAGTLPGSIPVGVLTSHDGKMMTTLGKLIENLPKVRQTSRALPNKNRAVTINGKRVILENGSIPGVLQEYIIRKLTPEIAAAKTKPLSFGLAKVDEDALAAEIYAKVPGIRVPSHAKLLATGRPEDLIELGKKTFNKYYVPAKADPRTGMPQTGQLGYKLTHETEIMRDPATGYPIRVDKNGEMPVGKIKEATGIPDTQRLNVMTDENVPWFGRQNRTKGSPYAPQTGTGPQQLGVLQAVRESLKNISGAGATISNSPDQAKLLTSVMTSLGIAVKETATPQQVFKQFQKEASLKFDEMVNGIEQAAKIESVALQTHRIFGGVGNSGDFLKMVERLELKTVQEAVINFSDNALLSVDEYCKAQYALLNGLDDIIG